MSRSKNLAGLLGPTLMALTLSEAINLHIWSANLAPVTYLNGLALLVAGLAIVRAHNHWTLSWPVLVTILGWCLVAGGLFRMFAPEAHQAGRNLGTYAVLAAGCAVGAFLTLKGYSRMAGMTEP